MSINTLSHIMFSFSFHTRTYTQLNTCNAFTRMQANTALNTQSVWLCPHAPHDGTLVLAALLHVVVRLIRDRINVRRVGRFDSIVVLACDLDVGMERCVWETNGVSGVRVEESSQRTTQNQTWLTSGV